MVSANLPLLPTFDALDCLLFIVYYTKQLTDTVLSHVMTNIKLFIPQDLKKNYIIITMTSFQYILVIFLAQRQNVFS